MLMLNSHETKPREKLIEQINLKDILSYIKNLKWS